MNTNKYFRNAVAGVGLAASTLTAHAVSVTMIEGAEPMLVVENLSDLNCMVTYEVQFLDGETNRWEMKQRTHGPRQMPPRYIYREEFYADGAIAWRVFKTGERCS